MKHSEWYRLLKDAILVASITISGTVLALTLLVGAIEAFWPDSHLGWRGAPAVRPLEDAKLRRPQGSDVRPGSAQPENRPSQDSVRPNYFYRVSQPTSLRV